MDYKEEMKAMFDKVYKEGFNEGFTEGLKAKFDKCEDEEITRKILWVGDEVKIKDGTIGVITRISQTNVGMLDAEGSTYWIGRKYVERTGRRYPELEKLFQKIKENNT